jgi:hypothetical protein
VAGQLRCYSALNIDAVILARHDHRDDAIEAAEEARNFEAEWEPTVKALAVELNLADFAAFRTARNELAQSLAPASEQLERLHTRMLGIVGTSVREEFVRIGAMTQHWTTLEILTPKLLPPVLLSQEVLDAIAEPIRRQVQQLAVDTFLPESAALHVGDVALLRIEHSAGSSLLSLLAAVGETEEDFALDEEAATYFSGGQVIVLMRSDPRRARSHYDRYGGGAPGLDSQVGGTADRQPQLLLAPAEWGQPRIVTDSPSTCPGVASSMKPAAINSSMWCRSTLATWMLGWEPPGNRSDAQAVQVWTTMNSLTSPSQAATELRDLLGLIAQPLEESAPFV